MTIQEKQSLRKKKSILYLVERGEYSLGYALLKTEELYDAGKLIDADYNELAEYLEGLLNKAEEIQETQKEIQVEQIEGPVDALVEDTSTESPIDDIESM